MLILNHALMRLFTILLVLTTFSSFAFDIFKKELTPSKCAELHQAAQNIIDGASQEDATQGLPSYLKNAVVLLAQANNNNDAAALIAVAKRISDPDIFYNCGAKESIVTELSNKIQKMQDLLKNNDLNAAASRLLDKMVGKAMQLSFANDYINLQKQMGKIRILLNSNLIDKPANNFLNSLQIPIELGNLDIVKYLKEKHNLNNTINDFGKSYSPYAYALIQATKHMQNAPRNSQAAYGLQQRLAIIDYLKPQQFSPEEEKYLNSFEEQLKDFKK